MSADSDQVHQAAIEWASTQIAVRESVLVSDNTWAATFRLRTPDGYYYLKVVPPAALRAVPAVVQIAGQLPGDVPQVVASEKARGWLLFSDHGGSGLKKSDDLIGVANAFAQIQARMKRGASPQIDLETVDLKALPHALMDFLTSPAVSTGDAAKVGAAYFLGDDAARYAQLLRQRLHLLAPLIEASSRLPLTLCHGDLQPRNIAQTPSGRFVFFDWDEAGWGPAGLCLPGLFSRCTHAAMLVHRWAESGQPGETPAARRLRAYVNALVEGGYASESVLLSGLIGSICAGQMRFVASFGRYPGEQGRDACGETLHDRLTDLLDLCDWLCTRTPGAVASMVADYQELQEWNRAFRLVGDQLAREPENLDWLVRYAHLACRVGDLEAADEAVSQGLSVAPENVDVRVARAHVRLLRLDPQASLGELSDVLVAHPDHCIALELSALAEAAHASLELAAQPGRAPCVALSSHEQKSGHLTALNRALVLSLFRRYGAVQIDNMFAFDEVLAMQGAFAVRYGRYFHEGDHGDALVVGHRRYMLTMQMDELFGRPGLIASNLVLPLMEELLGDEFILSAYTAVISLPGSQAQGIHKDHSPLFDEHGWQFPHPSFAVQVIVPLEAMNEETGATRLYKGSQRLDQDDASQLDFQDPTVPLGSCLLVDYAVAHCGLGNRSDKVRPILNLVYSRPWFRDARNYHLQPPLRFPDSFLEKAPESVLKLVDWWATERRVAGQATCA